MAEALKDGLWYSQATIHYQDHQSSSEQQAHPPLASSVIPSQTLPRLRTSLAADAVRVQLEAAARRGKLPGWRAEVRGSGTSELFAVTDYGTPFESVLTARVESEGAAGTVLSFTSAIKPAMPLVYAVVLVTTVWPGVWLTDSMLRSYFSGYSYKTWMWYLPLTAPFVPWAMWAAWKKSRTSGRAGAEESIRTIAGLIGGEVIGGIPSAGEPA
jgi:hypothetical protein